MYLHHACMFFTLCGYWFNCITVKIVHDDKDQSNCTLYINSFFLSKYLDGFLMVWQRDWMLESRRVFACPASEYVLGGLLPDEDYRAWLSIVQITEMVYNTGRSGWSEDDIILLENLILRHILTGGWGSEEFCHHFTQSHSQATRYCKIVETRQCLHGAMYLSEIMLTAHKIKST